VHATTEEHQALLSEEQTLKARLERLRSSVVYHTAYVHGAVSQAFAFADDLEAQRSEVEALQARQSEVEARLVLESKSRRAVMQESEPPEIRVTCAVDVVPDVWGAAKRPVRIDWIQCMPPTEAADSAERLWLPELGVYVSLGPQRLGEKMRPADPLPVTVARDAAEYGEDYGAWDCGCDYCMGIVPETLLPTIRDFQWSAEDLKRSRERKVGRDRRLGFRHSGSRTRARPNKAKRRMGRSQGYRSPLTEDEPRLCQPRRDRAAAREMRRRCVMHDIIESAHDSDI